MKKSNVNKGNKGMNKVTINESQKMINDSELLDKNLDEINFESLLSELEEKSKKEIKGKKESQYKIPVSTSIRKKLREKRDILMNEILVNRNDSKKLKSAFNTFDIFYRETYSLNDYSLLSMCSNNSEETTKVRLQLILDLMKRKNLI